MANYNEHKCLACGQIYEYCRRCNITPVIYKAEGFCSEECAHVFNTLSKHSCNLATTEETLAALKNIDGKKFISSIQEHIADMKKNQDNKISAVEPVEEVIEETVTEEPVQYFKKKRW